jgi:hypothetical protein
MRLRTLLLPVAAVVLTAPLLAQQGQPEDEAGAMRER